MSSDFTVCVFNMGSGASDYYQLCRYLQPSLKFSTREEDEAFRTKYQTVEKVTKRCFLKHHIDLYCLQEVADKERPLIKSLKKKGFHLVHIEGREVFDTLIALHPSRYKNITNHSFEVEITPHFKKDVAIATAIDIVTDKQMTLVSTHVPGFDFSSKDLTQEAAEGDLYCEKIMKTLHKIKDSQYQLIGADMNANPEIWNARFKTFQDSGFQILRSGVPTNVNTRDTNHQKREIDFLLIREEPKSSRFALIASKQKTIQATQKHMDLLEWDPEKNCSDHLPLIYSVSIART